MPLENGYSYWMNGLLALDQGLNAQGHGAPDANGVHCVVPRYRQCNSVLSAPNAYQ